MKKHILLLSASVLLSALPAFSQSAIDGAALVSSDIKGTARFMSMGGAFGALGGDPTTMIYNPAGIGIYRSSEISATLDIDIQNSSTQFDLSPSFSDNQTKALLNNFSYVGSSKVSDSDLLNFNWGISYNRRASFNRRYMGAASSISNSLSNYIAGVANNASALEGDLTSTSTFDPYNPSSDYAAPWLTILGYDSYLISPSGSDEQNPNWIGQFDGKSSGNASLWNEEKGGIDEYNISFGGNVRNVFYWGMDFSLANVDYTRKTYWNEILQNANVNLDNGSGFQRLDANWDMYNYYNVSGTGFNYKLGVIVKPIPELRIGFAAHTPTWYNLTETYYADTQYTYSQNGNSLLSGGAKTNGGYDGINDYRLRTPWRFIASAAGVIGGKFIISADVDWTCMQYLNFKTRNASYYYDYDYGYDDYYWSPKKADAYVSYSDPYYYTNQDVKDYYTTTTTLRIGAEYRLTPQFSIRAGYAFTSSPVKADAKDNVLTIYPSDPNPSYEFDNNTNYYSCGFGYRYKAFFIDAAYMYRTRSSSWHAFSPNIGDDNYAASTFGGPIAKVTSNNHQLVFTAGFKF